MHLPRASFVSFSALYLLIAALPLSAGAADFTIDDASTTARTLGKDEQGLVTQAGSLTVGGSTVAVTVTGNNATLNNQGAIRQTGTGRVVRDNSGVSTLVIINGSASNAGALLEAADADVIQMNKANASVTLDNYGTLASLNASAGGAQAVDFASITKGANVINNRAGGIIRANEADAVRTGVDGKVNNWGSILATTATGAGSDGIDAQENSGAVITNAGSVTGGRHGVTGEQSKASAAFTMTIINNAGASILGRDGSGVNIDGFNSKQVLSVTNAGIISGHGISGDGDGLDVDGIAHVVNSGIIRSLNAVGEAGETAYSEGISMGGGSIVNSGVIEGLSQGGARGRGITLAGNDITSGPLAGTREGLYANASITNLSGGVIRGQNDAAIVAVGAASGHAVSIDNRADAVIRGGSATGAAIQGGLDATTIVNAGLIDGASSAKAIALGSGDNHVLIQGGSIVGDIDGGSGGNNQLVVDLGAGGSFAYAHGLSNFSQVQVVSGHTTLSGVSDHAGVTQLSGGVLTLDGAQRLSAAGSLLLDGGTLQLNGAQSFASLALGGDSAVLLGGSSLTFGALGSIIDGATLSFTQAAAGAYAFRVLGDVTQDAAFMLLVGATSIDGLAASYRFDGAYTSVSAVPEPGTWGMLVVGLGLIGWMRRRAAA